MLRLKTRWRFGVKPRVRRNSSLSRRKVSWLNVVDSPSTEFDVTPACRIASIASSRVRISAGVGMRGNMRSRFQRLQEAAAETISESNILQLQSPCCSAFFADIDRHHNLFRWFRFSAAFAKIRRVSTAAGLATASGSNETSVSMWNHGRFTFYFRRLSRGDAGHRHCTSYASLQRACMACRPLFRLRRQLQTECRSTVRVPWIRICNARARLPIDRL